MSDESKDPQYQGPPMAKMWDVITCKEGHPWGIVIRPIHRLTQLDKLHVLSIGGAGLDPYRCRDIACKVFCWDWHLSGIYIRGQFVFEPTLYPP